MSTTTFLKIRTTLFVKGGRLGFDWSQGTRGGAQWDQEVSRLRHPCPLVQRVFQVRRNLPTV